MNEDLDVNILVQTFNERIAQLTTELIIKETTIKQLNATIAKMAGSVATTKKDKDKDKDFE